MRICQSHWTQLRDEITAQGLGDWVAPTGETAAAQLADQVRRGKITKVNYDPLMACHNMIAQRAVECLGVLVLLPSFECPICYLNAEARASDGTCKCGRPECPYTEPGSLPDFETWIVGPDSCVTAARQYMTRKGWLSD